MITINFDTSFPQYEIKCDYTTIGRQYDNIADAFRVIIPETERGNTCTMMFRFENTPIDSVVLDSEIVGIYNNITRFPYIDIAFTFTNTSGYTRNTNIRRLYFCPAMKPTNFVPGTPTIVKNVETIVKDAITNLDYNEKGVLLGENIFGKVVDAVWIGDAVKKNIVDQRRELPEATAGAPDFVMVDNRLYVLTGEEPPVPEGFIFTACLGDIPTEIDEQFVQEDIPADFARNGAVHYFTTDGEKYECFAYPASFGELKKIYQNDLTAFNLITVFNKIVVNKDGVDYNLYHRQNTVMEYEAKYQFLFK